MSFEEFCESRGFDAATLSDKQREALLELHQQSLPKSADRLDGLAFHKSDKGFVVSVRGEMATPAFIDALGTVLNGNVEVLEAIKTQLRQVMPTP